MSTPPRWLQPRLWLALPACALAFLAWTDGAWIGRSDYISGLPGRAHPVDKPDPATSAGDPGVLRDIILPAGDYRAFGWIEQTQQMVDRGELRVRRVDYENAPAGHPTSFPSPYRWWMGVVAWCHNAYAGGVFDRSIERSALLADPWLHVLLLAGTAAFAAWRFGWAAGAVAGLGAALVFPLATRFVPGMPGPSGLSAACALGSVLLFLAGMRPAALGGSGGARLWPGLAGVAGGLGLWVSVQAEAPLLVGIGLGGLAAAAWRRWRESGESGPAPAPEAWRAWGMAGGASTLCAYLAENFPDRMTGWDLAAIHPLYGLAWVGAGELLARATLRIGRPGGARSVRGSVTVLIAMAALLAPLLLLWRTGSRGFMARDPFSTLLTFLPGGAAAGNAGAWLARDWATSAAWAAVLPLLAVGLSAALALRRQGDPLSRAAIAVALGPAVVALAFAGAELSWWTLLDGALVALAAAAAAPGWSLGRLPGGGLVAAAVGVCALAGGAQLLPHGGIGPQMKLTQVESEELVDRHLGHWLALHAGQKDAIVFAPPTETASLCFYGGLRGLGTFAPDNASGFNATMAIASAPSMDEAHDYLQRREVRFVVIPLWDHFFDNLGKLYLAGKPASHVSLLSSELRSFNLPPWIRPIPYQTPIEGVTGQLEVLVFEIVDAQTPATAASRLAEYLVEMGQLDLAAKAGERLLRFPGDVGALVARAEVQIARGDSASSAKTVAALMDRLASGADRYLPWDLRVGLAIVLAQSGRIDACRDQARRCAAEANEARLRSLTTGSLYSFEVISRSLGIDLPDARLRALGLDLLPVDLRNRL